jgi:hypothetical protein
MSPATTRRKFSVWRLAKLRWTPTSASIILIALSLRYAAIKNSIDSSNVPPQPSAADDRDRAEVIAEHAWIEHQPDRDEKRSR